MRDLSGLLGFGALWRIGTLFFFFSAGEVCELRLRKVSLPRIISESNTEQREAKPYKMAMN